MKYRFDYNINDEDFLNKISVRPNILYNDSDLIFYSESLTFIKVFKTFYTQLKNYSYIGGSKSWSSSRSFQSHLKSVNIQSKGIKIGRIIRGLYKKERDDGKKKLYINNIIQGKFTK